MTRVGNLNSLLN